MGGQLRRPLSAEVDVDSQGVAFSSGDLDGFDRRKIQRRVAGVQADASDVVGGGRSHNQRNLVFAGQFLQGRRRAGANRADEDVDAYVFDEFAAVTVAQ